MSYIDELAVAIRAKVNPAILPRLDVARLLRICAALALAKGEAVTAKDIHDAWRPGSATGSRTASTRPFEDLSPDVQRSNERFVEAIRQVVRERVTPGAFRPEACGGRADDGNIDRRT